MGRGLFFTIWRRCGSGWNRATVSGRNNGIQALKRTCSSFSKELIVLHMQNQVSQLTKSTAWSVNSVHLLKYVFLLYCNTKGNIDLILHIWYVVNFKAHTDAKYNINTKYYQNIIKTRIMMSFKDKDTTFLLSSSTHTNTHPHTRWHTTHSVCVVCHHDLMITSCEKL